MNVARSLLLLLVSFQITAVFAVDPISEQKAYIEHRGAFTLPRTSTYDITSHAGRVYRIFIAEPEGAAPPAGFPVIYVLDANSCFGTIVEAHRIQSRRGSEIGATPAVIVGLGYPTEGTYDQTRRTFDLTPTADIKKLPPRRNNDAWPPTGGANEFFTFLQDVVKPHVASTIPIDSQRQSIFGHSFGGLFVLHTMFHHPDSFQNYIAASPSAWWNDYMPGVEAAEFIKQKLPLKQPIKLLITVGELETGSGPAFMLPKTPNQQNCGTPQKIAEILSQQPEQGFSVQFKIFAGENHGSVIPHALNEALLFSFSRPSDGKPPTVN
jgi:hypothetical protein